MGMGWDVGLWVHLSQWGPWPGRVVGAGAQPCCGIAGAEADGPGGTDMAWTGTSVLLSDPRTLAAMAQMSKISEANVKTQTAGCADIAVSICFGANPAVLVKGRCKHHYPGPHGGVVPGRADTGSHEEPQHLHS